MRRKKQNDKSVKRCLQTVITACVSVILCTTVTYAQEYEDMWKEAYDLWQDKQLPQSAIAKADEIYHLAESRKDSAQMMKAMLFAMYQHGALSADSFYTDIQRLEDWADTPSLACPDAAIVHSVLGEIYQKAAARGNYSPQAVARRPEEMDQWTTLMYHERAFEHYIASVAHLERLANVSYKQYPIIYDGRWSRYFNDDLMHVVGRRAIFGLRDLQGLLAQGHRQSEWDFAPDYHTFMNQAAARRHTATMPYDCTPHIMNLFARILKICQKNNLRDAWLLTELNRLSIIPTHLINADEHLHMLDRLKNEYDDCEVAGAIYLDIARLLARQERWDEQLAIVREGIRKYPQYGGINQLHNMEEEILQPRFTLNSWEYKTQSPGSKRKIRINYRNLTQCTIRLYRIEARTDSIFLHQSDREWLKKHSKLAQEELYSLHYDYHYRERDTTLQITLPQAYGNYLITAMAGQKESEDHGLLHISSLHLEGITLPEGKMELTVLHSQTGHPIPQATIHTASMPDREHIIPAKTWMTDRHGNAIITLPQEELLLRPTKGDDNCQIYQRRWHTSRVSDNNRQTTERNLHLFTDRSIYRPGQEVSIKGVAYNSTSTDYTTQAISNEKFIMELLDPKGNTIRKDTVQTGDFGSFSTSLPLARTSMKGTYRIRMRTLDGKTPFHYRYTSFQVEEYKRPTFEAAFDTIRQTYSLNDTITLHGYARSYTRTPVAHSQVKVSIVRLHQGYLRHPGDRASSTHPTTLQTTTDSTGHFSIRIHLKAEPGQELCRYWHDQYSVNATVTSPAGESHEATTSVTLSSVPIRLDMTLPEKWQKKAGNMLTLNACNLSGHPLDIPVSCALYRYSDAENLPLTELPTHDLVWHDTLPANRATAIAAWDNLPSGRYLIVSKAGLSSTGNEIKSNRIICIHSSQETKVPAGYDVWCHWTQEKFAPGKPAQLQFGTNKQDVYLMMDVFCPTGRLESKRIVMSDTVRNFTFDYHKEYGQSITVNLLFIKDGERYAHSHTIQREKPEKSLRIQWSTFRNRLTPTPQKETWTIRITHPDSTAAEAEVLASMYDASLDRFYPHEWDFALQYMTTHIPFRRQAFSQKTNYWIHIPFDFTRKEIPQMWRYADVAEIFTSAGTPTGYPERIGLMTRQALPNRQTKATLTGAGNIESDKAAVYDMAEEEADSHAGLFQYLQPSGHTAKSADYGNSLRQNLHETAFFFPHLLTDKNGTACLTFSIPESLTSWHFQAFAHTKDLAHGYLSDWIITHKKFMVRPNMPRFVRQGDETTITTSISNLTAKDLEGEVCMELFDPANDKVILSRRSSFQASKEEEAYITFRFTTPNSCPSLLACRIIAETEEFSDGEQHYLPVLSDKEWLTESHPIEIVRAGKTAISLNQLFNRQSPSATGHRLTIEFTRNPLWTVIQALPTITAQPSDNALSVASAYYAHNMAAYLMNAHPRIKEVIEQNHIGDTCQSSPLDTDNESKLLLMEETPWIAEMQKEKEHQKNLKLLFDDSYTTRMSNEYIEKLASLQRPDGSWSWFKGMAGNLHTTLAIMEMLERLTITTGQAPNRNVRLMQDKGHAYLSNWLKKEVASMRQSVPSSCLHYLYILAISGRQPDADVQQAIDGLLDKLLSNRHSLTLASQAQAIIILHKYGHKEKAAALAESLLEQTSITETAGRYFDQMRFNTGWRNDQIPTQVKTIEALGQIGGYAHQIEEMKRWLLGQKRTQSWDTPLNSVEAVHALLAGAAMPLDEPSPIKLELDKQPVVPSEKGTGTGYFRLTYSEEDKELQTLPQEISIEKADEGIVWGAVYAQCLEDADRIASTYTGHTSSKHGRALNQSLSIGRQLLVERTADGSSHWEPVRPDTPLKVGDQVISRLIVRTNRAMDFVQVKDNRAACTEPVSTRAGMIMADGLAIYCSPQDASTLYFIDHLPKGSYTIDTRLCIDRAGHYQLGTSSVQCTYAPEFVGHTAGQEIIVSD